ncbi:MAG TPA: isoleucine--tRNA ligase [Polyangiaceae bacterium]|jgi:isoleucyl-tRNA synthetase
MSTVFDKVPSEMNFPAEEKEILSFWREHRIFEKSIEQSKDKPAFVFYEGPPTANGLPHNGHVLTRVIKDVFPRYKTMRGHFVGRKAGWDTHGLPVEVEVEKELRIHGKAAIEQYGVEPFIAKCIDSVFRYTREWEELTERIGFWVDLGDAYVTYHKSYVESVWWALGELFKKGLLYRGHKVVWWWAQGGTALSAAEVGQGYRQVDDPSVYVRFPLKDGRALVVWTTTPWTLSSNMYAAVKADVDYVTVEHGDEKLILAAALREPLAKKLKTELPVVATCKGKDLVDLEYAPPFDTFKNEKHRWRVIAADFVTLDTGTGIVHIAPAFGEDDYDAHRRIAPDEGLLCAVKSDGNFIDAMGSKYAGRWVKDCDKELSAELKERGLLLFAETYRHDYPFCPRAENDPLIQFARPAWYIRTTKEIARAIANNEAVHWLPEHIKEGRMGDFLRNNVDWALSRERFWGTPLNVWQCEKCSAECAPTSVAELRSLGGSFSAFEEDKKKNPNLSDHLIVHKPWIDKVTLPCSCGATMKRVPEVIDCWFDSGAMPFAQWGYPHVPGSAEKFEKNFPADFISEAIDQTRGWFYSLLMISTLVFGDRPLPHPYETCLVLGHVGDKEGKKESKSKGNYTPPDIVYDEVKLEFAVMDATKLKGSKPQPGVVLVAKEDLEGLDLLPGAKVEVQCGAAMIAATVQSDKGLPRRVAVLDDADRARLGASVTRKSDVKPAEVARLPLEERIVVRDPETPAPGADAFRWFFYASSPPWSNTRHSLSNVRALQKEFLVKLRNTYSFFTIYANIDGWTPLTTDSGTPSELDRWCQSELADTVRVVTERMDAYDVYGATQRLIDFVDALSNWYVRRSRERFWRSGMDRDKLAAYATLYDSLEALSVMLAPFVPFTAERMYQNLVRRPLGDGAKESVHLCEWPASATKTIDEKLQTKMRAVRDLVSLGLQVRTQNKLKVRQPLRAAHVILSKPALEAELRGVIDTMKEELNVLAIEFVPVARAREFVEYQLKPNFRSLGQKGRGKEAQMLKGVMGKLGAEQAAALNAQLLGDGKITVEGVELAAEDVEVAFTTKEGFAAAGDRTGVVALETALDDHLRELGFLRELQSRIQAMRKELGLEFTDRIVLGLSGGPRLSAVLAKYTDVLAREVLAAAIERSHTGDAVEAEVEGEAVRISILRA